MIIVIFSSQATLNLNLESIVYPLVSKSVSAVFSLSHFSDFLGMSQTEIALNKCLRSLRKCHKWWEGVVNINGC